MKNNLKVNALAVMLATGVLFGQSACTRAEKENTENAVENAGQESEEAFNNFKAYIEEADRDTAYVYDSSRDWNKELTDRETAYNERVSNLDKYSTNYDEARRAEIEEMKTRYNTNWETRRATYTSYGKAGSMRSELLTVEENAKDLNTLTGANIRAAYENFVAKVEANKKNYSNADWKIVEQSWNDLDDRKNAIQSELSAKDKYEIGKAKTKYLAMKNTSKIGNTAENVGSDVKDATTSGANKVGDAAKEGGSKVGNAASKVGSAVKDTYKKAEDKVDGTKDGK